MSKVYEGLLARLFPELCPRCGVETQRGYCTACRGEFVRVPDPCPGCGLARPVLRCPRRGGPWHLDAVVTPYAYAPPLAAELVKLKRDGGRHLGRALGLLLAGHVAPLAGRIDTLVPVPLHASRLRERGFNQALEIGHALARSIRVALRAHEVARTHKTRLQAGLDAARRGANLEHAFRARRAAGSIAIVDDVVTTGATVNALAAELRGRGAARVEAWAVARTQARNV